MAQLRQVRVLVAVLSMAMILSAVTSCSEDRSSATSQPTERRQSDPKGAPSSAPTCQGESQFRVPWEHESITQLARLFLDRGGENIAKNYPLIPPEHLTRLRDEYGSHRRSHEKDFAQLSKAEIAALYMAVQPFWSAETWKQEDEDWQECVFYTAADGTTVAVGFQQAHPFLAEFHRKAIIASPDTAPIELPLPMNVGGRTNINVYFYPRQDGSGPAIRLQDHWGQYMLDLKRKVSRLIIRVDGSTYAGDLHSERASSGWSQADGGPESVEIDGRPAQLLQGTLAGPGQYLGRLDGTKGPVAFIPASSEKERSIPMAHEP